MCINGTELKSLQVNPYTSGQLTFNKGDKITQ